MKYSKPHTDTEGTRARLALLAKVHIAKKELGLTEIEYRDIVGRYRVESAAFLSIRELEELVGYFTFCGWKPKSQSRILQLRARVRLAAGTIENGGQRLAGLVKTICGADRLEWCRDPEKLLRLLAALNNYVRRET